MPILVLIVFVPFWGMAEQFETLTVPTYVCSVDPFAPDSLAPRGAFPLSNLSSSLPIPNIHSAQKSENVQVFYKKNLLDFVKRLG